MDQKNKNQYHHTNKLIDSEVDNIFYGNYDQVILGTIDKNEYPFLSKIIPMYYRNKIYLLFTLRVKIYPRNFHRRVTKFMNYF